MSTRPFLAFACAHTTEAMAACVPGSHLVLIEDCGHLSTIEQPTSATGALSDWLNTSLTP